MLHLSEILEARTQQSLECNKHILEYCKDLQLISESSKQLQAVIERFLYGVTVTSTLLERVTIVAPAKVGFDINWVPQGRILNIEKTIERCQPNTRMKPLLH